MIKKMYFPWSDNWWKEGTIAWFCAGDYGALFSVDIGKQTCRLVSYIPECPVINFRMYPYCIKYKTKVFCLPSKGLNVWCYDLITQRWEKIVIANKERTICEMFCYNDNANEVWLREFESGRILGLNLERGEIDKEYRISMNNCGLCGEHIMGQHVLVENEIYVVNSNRIYRINPKTDEITTYPLVEVKAELFTICYDGLNFWLSGYCKEIYIWNVEKGIIKIVSQFPENFGLYLYNDNSLVDSESFFSNGLSFFGMSIPMKDHVWFIPAQANQILYMSKRDYSIQTFDVGVYKYENGHSEGKEEYVAEYTVQYVEKDRYIGMYSFKTRMSFEIDTVELCVRHYDFLFDNQTILQMGSKFCNGRKVFMENNKNLEMEMFSMMLNYKKEESNNLDSRIGQSIYNKLKEV
ncbi:MAG: hypothetical protein NC416_00085 [Eubacterium sp.]|nr:hypothetical protein [Eubacterium sp.]